MCGINKPFGSFYAPSRLREGRLQRREVNLARQNEHRAFEVGEVGNGQIWRSRADLEPMSQDICKPVDEGCLGRVGPQIGVQDIISVAPPVHLKEPCRRNLGLKEPPDEFVLGVALRGGCVHADGWYDVDDD